MVGSVNMSGCGMQSSGEMIIINDIRAVRSIDQDFVRALVTTRSLEPENVIHYADCTKCIQHQLAN